MKKKANRVFETTIIGGKHKGKKIVIPASPTTRSSKNILRESLFNTLQFEIVDTPFVEVFAGSGSIGLEALSRGADKVIFLERESEAIRALKENIDKLGCDNCHIIFGDSFANLARTFEILDLPSYFYFDPPFAIREGMEDIYEQSVALIASIPTELVKMVIVEHMSNHPFPSAIGDLERRKTKRFGKSTLSYYAPKDQDA